MPKPGGKPGVDGSSALQVVASAIRGVSEGRGETPDFLETLDRTQGIVTKYFPNDQPSGSGVERLDNLLAMAERHLAQRLRYTALNDYLSLGWKLSLIFASIGTTAAVWLR